MAAMSNDKKNQIKPKLLLGVIADDMTGASDVALMLARGGLATVQIIGVPPSNRALPLAEAVVIALKSRTAPVDEAVAQSLAALRVLRAQGAQQILFKYCSTFDSTPQGNIGPIADALMHELGVDFALICPAFPATGRTIYQGYLFVSGVPLHESPMKDHPLTPMRDANLMRLMAAQSRHRVGLVPLDIVRQGVEAVRARCASLKVEGFAYAVADVVSDEDLRVLGQAAHYHGLITGGSGIALGLPDNFSAQRTRPVTLPFTLPKAGKAVILAGSCSAMTRRQITIGRLAGLPSFHIDPLALHSGEMTAERLADFAVEAAQPAILYSSAEPETVAKIQSALGRAHAGSLIEAVLAKTAQILVGKGFTRFVVAGGETSGAVVQALGIRALEIGPEIDPGVPWMRVIDGPQIAVTLKSGNFGAEDFFKKALDA